MGQAVIGISPAAIAAATAVPAFRLGTVGGYDDPTDGYKEFVYGRAAGIITGAGYICLEGVGGDWALATLTTSAPGAATGVGSRAGAAMAALADNEYGWFQIYGKGSVRVAGAVAIGTRLNTTATGGALDDDGTAGSEPINGLNVKVLSGGAETNTTGVFNYPVVGMTI